MYQSLCENNICFKQLTLATFVHWVRLLLHYTTWDTKADSTRVHWQHAGETAWDQNLPCVHHLLRKIHNKTRRQSIKMHLTLLWQVWAQWPSAIFTHPARQRPLETTTFLENPVKRKRNPFSMDLTISLLLF